MNEVCMRCGDSEVKEHISNKHYPLCRKCHDDWIEIINRNTETLNELRNEKFTKFWNKLWSKFIRCLNVHVKVQFT